MYTWQLLRAFAMDEGGEEIGRKRCKKMHHIRIKKGRN
jgi:hypothetical protein